MGIEFHAVVDRRVVAFIETTLPHGVDAIRAGGIEYVARVESVADLPEWADAVRLGDVAYTRKAF